MKKLQIAISNSVNDSGVLELMFLDDIRDYIDWDAWEVVSLVEDIVSKVKAAQPQTIRCTINSYGGDCVIGFAIYNFLKNYAADVEVEIIGIAGSIATVIASAASPGRLRIARNAFFVIHQAWGGAVGTSKDIRNAADVIDTMTDNIADIYAQRTGKSADAIKALIPAGVDYWMTGADAVEQGFCDEVIAENGSFAIAACIGGLKEAGYKNIPASVLASAKDQDTPSQLQSIFMKFKNLLENFSKTLVGAKVEAPAGTETPAITGEALNAAIAPAMEEMLTGIEAQFDNELKEAETRISNALEQKFEDRLKKLETENKTLSDDVASKLGGEAATTEKQENTVRKMKLVADN